MAGPSPRHRPHALARPALPCRGCAGPITPRGRQSGVGVVEAAGGACGCPTLPRASSHNACARRPGRPGNRCVSRLGELGALLRRRSAAPGSLRLRLSRRRPAPGPAREPQPPAYSRAGEARAAPWPASGGSEQAGGPRRAAGPWSPPRCARPSGAQPRGALEPVVPAPSGDWASPRGCVGGRAHSGGRRGRLVQSTLRAAHRPLPRFMDFCGGGRGLHNPGLGALLKMQVRLRGGGGRWGKVGRGFP